MGEPDLEGLHEPGIRSRAERRSRRQQMAYCLGELKEGR
jgi:hypothetical protein